jgi:hypothetical protein
VEEERGKGEKGLVNVFFFFLAPFVEKGTARRKGKTAGGRRERLFFSLSFPSLSLSFSRALREKAEE